MVSKDRDYYTKFCEDNNLNTLEGYCKYHGYDYEKYSKDGMIVTFFEYGISKEFTRICLENDWLSKNCDSYKRELALQTSLGEDYDGPLKRK